MGSKVQLLDPDKHVTVGDAALMTSKRSLHRTIKAVEEGATSVRTSNEWQLVIAKLFVRMRAAHRDVTVRGIFEAVGLPAPSGPVPLQSIGKPPRKAKQLRTRKEPATNALPPLEAAADATAEQKKAVRQLLDEVVRSYQTKKTGRPPWKQITDIVIWLVAAGDPPQTGKLLGHSLATLTHENRPRFATIGDFLADGRPDDVWVFVLQGEATRPRDILRASASEVLFGHIVVLTLREWAKAFDGAIASEDLQAEAMSEVEALRALVAVPKLKGKKPAR